MLKNYFTKGLIEAGCDEAGRGCLAGPVTAAAVILPKNFKHKLLNDSKQVTESNRNELRHIIEEKALAFGVAFLDHKKIDEINILQASILAMHHALDKLAITPEHIIVDGNRFKPYKFIPHTTVVKGDAKFLSIAAASILAKTYRDEYLEKLDMEFPMYHWKKNKGYPTKQHRNGIREFGPSKYHRMTFRLLPEVEEGLVKVKISPISNRDDGISFNMSQRN
ncbi:ribonuclease HII [Salibacteraceae bacterium]|jgi:ribonuclease HII|nr:ribonuclease HII [Crocinitomicaceae bacterium]MCH9823489.1 ribonuclease HII [Bacteroidota bacterium]MDA7730523.1 ribonuclease HII [Salibacteraceae bacterium]MDB0058418.1 ribonuclease HII [Salibacteraceae bacterium]MDB9724756.1 ribonuclease HII [Salibacteraceae bacterium]|tara:strand:+ start:19131 stop:19796 length:666 start_codon:yes stop_codon:yes gene_type:complete